jgi:hypothetical protein
MTQSDEVFDVRLADIFCGSSVELDDITFGRDDRAAVDLHPHFDEKTPWRLKVLGEQRLLS